MYKNPDVGIGKSEGDDRMNSGESEGNSDDQNIEEFKDRESNFID
ncbi:4408_t:CDS:1, partial [Ambispora gerdemannii]